MEKRKPCFLDGIILTKEMLTSLTNFTFEMPDMLKAEYTNGIISGVRITTTEDLIMIGNGVVKVGSSLYLTGEDLKINYSPTNKLTYLKLRSLGEQKQNNEFVSNFELVLEETETEKDEIELCRFKLQKGARLRYEYDNFEDLSTEYDTINIINRPFSSKGKSGMSLEIVKMFARELLELKTEDEIDRTFCMQVLCSNETINMEGIAVYIELKTGEKLEDMSNKKVYRKLLEILEEEKAKLSGSKKKKAIKKHMILVD